MALFSQQPDAQNPKAGTWLSGVFENAFDAYVVLDSKSSVILDVNRRASLLFALGREQLQGAPFERFCTEDSRAYHRGLLHRACSGEPVMGELELTFPDARALAVEIAYGPSAGYPRAYVILSVRDLTERRRAERERALVATRRYESQRLESLNVLVGGVAHDFNNILMSILGYAIIGKDKGASDPAVARYFSQIESSTIKAGDLCRKMLAFAGRAELNQQRGSVGQILAQFEAELRVLIGGKAELLLHANPALPEVMVDPKKLVLVLANIFQNSLESFNRPVRRISVATFFSPLSDPRRVEGFMTPEIPSRDAVVIEVTDTGAGISADRISRIFEPFFSTKFIGRGLGLSEALGIMRTLQGAIQVQSVLGQGSCFRLYLPVAETATTPPSATKLSTPPFLSSAVQRSLALIVDDEPENRAYVESLLKESGFSVRQAPNGQEALQLLERHGARITLVILDLTMPELSGPELLQKIRTSKHKDMRVIVMSGYSREEVYERCYPFRPDGFLQKPFISKDLLALIS